MFSSRLAEEYIHKLDVLTFSVLANSTLSVTPAFCVLNVLSLL